MTAERVNPPRWRRRRSDQAEEPSGLRSVDADAPSATHPFPPPRPPLTSRNPTASGGSWAGRASDQRREQVRARGPVVVPDGEPVGRAISSAAAGGARVVLTTGGTGLTPTDRTPEETGRLLDFEVPGIADAIRAAGVDAGVPTAVLSRGVAGVIGDCLVVNLPGSRGGVKDGLAVLEPILVHAVEQVVGSDH